VELLVASVIVSIGLLGVYGVLKQAMAVYTRTGAAWSRRDAADAIADTLAEAVDNSIAVQNMPAVAAKKLDRGWQCTVRGYCDSGMDSGVDKGLLARRFTYQTPDDGRAGTLTVQSRQVAGRHDLNRSPDQAAVTVEQLWPDTPEQLIGREIDSLSIRYRPADGSGGWSDEWNKKDKAVEADIRVTVGGQAAERSARQHAVPAKPSDEEGGQ